MSCGAMSSIPGQPPTEVDLPADEVEEKRLKRMGVLRDLLEEEQGLEILTARFVHDWRIKIRKFKSAHRSPMIGLPFT